jgi:hypothetical protein
VDRSVVQCGPSDPAAGVADELAGGEPAGAVEEHGTCASTLARTSGSCDPAAAWNSGKSMKFVPTALTCTPVAAISSATLRAIIVAPARTAE